MYDEKGQLVWETHLDIYGKVRTFAGRSLSDCPFRYQGQYEDSETGLYYNRFRYYSPEEGMYLSQDPIGLAGNNPTLYGYVSDPNSWVDVFGLDVDLARKRQYKMLTDNVGYNISPTSWDSYSTIGRTATFITDKEALNILGDFSGKSEITISKSIANQLETNMGLMPGSLEGGFKIREVTDIISQFPRSPLKGNLYFKGPGQHLPDGSPELVINSIPTTDNKTTKTILTVKVGCP
jgi:RHS repeat-associated protein